MIAQAGHTLLELLGGYSESAEQIPDLYQGLGHSNVDARIDIFFRMSASVESSSSRKLLRFPRMSPGSRAQSLSPGQISREIRQTLRRSPSSASAPCPSVDAGWSRRRRTPTWTLWGYILLAVDEEQHTRSTTPAATRAGTSTRPPAWRSAAATSCWRCATTRTPSRSPA